MGKQYGQRSIAVECRVPRRAVEDKNGKRVWGFECFSKEWETTEGFKQVYNDMN